MDRREHLEKLLGLGLCTCTLSVLDLGDQKAYASSVPDDELTLLKSQKEFIQNWRTDLLETMDTELDEKAKIKLMEGCGRGCFRRFKFKQDIAAKGTGDLEKLMEAYKQNFEIWREGNIAHIRYGEVCSHCYCPAANYRIPKPNDLHCECTRTTHQTIFETALSRPFKVDIVEALRRGGKTCHFAVHLS